MQEQTNRIAFDRVESIEIISGTPTNLIGVRNKGHIINVVTRTPYELSITVTSYLSISGRQKRAWRRYFL
ncbi:MAG: hypothetical protein RL839_08620 [Gammaproteobacteria bacterium]